MKGLEEPDFLFSQTGGDDFLDNPNLDLYNDLNAGRASGFLV